MVCAWVYRDAVCIRSGRHVVQPLVCLGVNDAHDRTREQIARREIVLVVARVIPNLVHATDLRDFQAVGIRRRIRYPGIRRHAGYVAARVLLMMYSLAGNVWPSWSAQPTRKLSPGPCTMLVGMQSYMGKLFTTTGPLPVQFEDQSHQGCRCCVVATEFSLVSNQLPLFGS